MVLARSAEDGGRHAVGGLVHQVAGEVLRLADDAALRSRAFFERLLVLVAAGDDGQLLDLLIFAVAAVVVGIEVADQRAFDDGLARVLRRECWAGMKAKLRRPLALSVRTAAPAMRRSS